MKPSPGELAGLRSDGLTDRAFRDALRESARSVARWDREHPATPVSVSRAVAAIIRVFPQCVAEPELTEGEEFPLL